MSTKDPGSTRGRGLEFIHITKTGGTSIELAAASAGIVWGACKFYNDRGCTRPANQTKNILLDKEIWACNPTNQTWKIQPWHCPPSQFQRRNMYYGSDTFAIVRNPYSRIISEFYWASGIKIMPKDVRAINTWIQQQLDNVVRFGSCVLGHCIPMHKFTHIDGEQAIDHVLRLENITEELPVLLKSYGLDNIIRLGHKNRRRNDAVLDVRHLTNVTICKINEVYSHDFVLFGYDMIGQNCC